MSLLEQGIKKGFIKISDDEKQINCCNHHKPRIFTNLEEKVQAEAFLKLVIDYGYNPKRIKHYKLLWVQALEKLI